MAQTLIASYNLGSDPAAQVQLRVHIGFGHRALSRVKLGTKVIIIKPPAGTNGRYTDDFTIPIGTNADLAGLKLAVLTTVTQFSQDTRTNVEITLNNGDNDQKFTQKETAAGVGTVVSYDAKFSLV